MKHIQKYSSKRLQEKQHLNAHILVFSRIGVPQNPYDNENVGWLIWGSIKKIIQFQVHFELSPKSFNSPNPYVYIYIYIFSINIRELDGWMIKHELSHHHFIPFPIHRWVDTLQSDLLFALGSVAFVLLCALVEVDFFVWVSREVVIEVPPKMGWLTRENHPSISLDDDLGKSQSKVWMMIWGPYDGHPQMGFRWYEFSGGNGDGWIYLRDMGMGQS